MRTALPLINVWGPPAVHSLSVMTKNWKYVYWPYAEGELEPVEELYCTEQDPLELTNRAKDPAAARTLERMRTVYDTAVADWQQKAVAYHRYAAFGVVFDRNVPWADKRDAALGLDAKRAAAAGTPARNARTQSRKMREDTVCGTGQPENNGDAGTGTDMNVGDPFGVEIGPDGALYVTEVRHHRVRRLDLQSGQLTTVVGCGRKGYSGDGGPATQAELNEPYEVRFDQQGNMYFVEMQNHVIRKVAAKTGVISTIAGTGQAGYGGDGGPAVAAMFNRPHSIALDGRGNLYVADIGNHRIRRIDLQTGIVDTIAGDGGKRLPRSGQSARGSSVLGPRALMVDGTTLWVALARRT